MKFGIFLLLQSPDMRPSQETYAHALEQGVLADQLGFDYIVAAEHHFSSYGFLPCPLLLIPTLAERTKQIRFSTAVVVLPLRNPIQLAEEIAMLDIVTRGRVEVGFGTGYQQYEFQRFGVNLAENRAMFEEALELLTKLLSTENVSHQGRYWTLPETTTLPRPITRPHPQFWRATSTVPTMAWSLERGIKVITGGTASSMDRIINNWHLFQDAVEAARASWPQEFIINRGVYVSDSEADAKSMLPHAIWHTRTARGLSSNSLPVNAGRAMTDLPHDPVRWRHLLELYLQPWPDSARENHALHGAVCHQGHAALSRLYARPGAIPAQGQGSRSQRVLRLGGRHANDLRLTQTLALSRGV